MDQMLFHETEDALYACGYVFLANGEYVDPRSGTLFDRPRNDYDLYEIQHELGMTTAGEWPTWPVPEVPPEDEDKQNTYL